MMSLSLVACAGSTRHAHSSDASTTPPLIRVVVFPEHWLTLTPSIDVDAAAAASVGLTESGGVEVQDRTTTAGAVAAGDGECSEEPECVRAIGRELDVERAVVIGLAELGDTVLVRVSVMDVVGGTREHTRQEVVHEATAQAVEAAISRIARELGQTYAPQRETERRWYQRWWVWTIVGVALAGGAVGAIVGTTVVDDEPQPDVTVTLP